LFQLRYGGVFPDFPYNDWLVSLSKEKKVLDELVAMGYTVDDTAMEFLTKSIS
jgi:hypothetical protein